MMNGVEIEYFLGIYFIVISLSVGGGKLSFDIIKGVAGLILFVGAILGLTLI